MKSKMKNKMKFLKDFFFDKKYIKPLIISIIVLISFYIFMKFTLLITVDGSKYYSYLKYFKGQDNIGKWDTIRGFSFPFVLYVITSIFGDNIRGVLIGFFLFYIGLIYFAYKIITILVNDNKLEKKQFSVWIIFSLLFLFNPLIIGYSHTLLTEAITPFFYMFLLYILLKYNDMSFKKNKKLFIIYSIIIILIFTFVWFIKQPYAPAVWILLIINSILSGLYYRNIKFFLEKFIVFIICILFTVVSIWSWNFYLDSKIDGDYERKTNSSILADSLGGYQYHFKKIDKEIYCNNKYINLIKTDKSTINKLKKLQKKSGWCDSVIIYDVTNIKGKVIEQQVYFKSNNKTSLKESILFLIKEFIRHPLIIMHSYYEGYLAIINMEEVKLPEYVPSGKIKGNVYSENNGIGYIVFWEGYKNAWWLWQDKNALTPDLLELSTGMEHYESETTTNSVWSQIMQMLEEWSNVSFKFLLFFCLPILIYSFIKFIINRKSLSYYTMTLLSGTTFIHILFHVFNSALIDRYVYVVYPFMLLCLVIMLMNKDNSEGEIK